MSDRPRGEGWWLASDGRWYPPESRPAGQPADGWWLASDGNWYPPETRPGEPAAPQGASDGAPGEGWWLASDGNWYPPDTRPGATSEVAVRDEAGAGAAMGRGITTALRYFLYAMAVLSFGAALATVNEIVAFADFVDGGPASDLVDAEDFSAAVIGWLALGSLATGILFLVWTQQAYKAVADLGAAGTRWSPGWAVGGWFIPLANLVIPKLVINEIDRISHAGPAPVGERWQSVRPLATGYWWWGCFLAAGALVVVASAVIGAELDALVLDPDTYRFGLSLRAAGYAVYLMAALLGASLVRTIGARLEAG